ncbi:hypothetical protein [Pelotalea chapellei]
MTNHVHLLVQVGEVPLSRIIHNPDVALYHLAEPPPQQNRASFSWALQGFARRCNGLGFVLFWQ